jgi:hypothetical protein
MKTVLTWFSQAFDAESGENRISYRAVTSSFGQAFDAESGEDQISYRAVTSARPDLVSGRDFIF